MVTTEMPQTLEAAYWGYAFSLKDATGVTWGRLLMGDWLEPATAKEIAERLCDGFGRGRPMIDADLYGPPAA